MATPSGALVGNIVGTPESQPTTASVPYTNVGEVERWASAIGGGALALYGLRRGSLGGIALAIIGGALIQRGVSGHSELYSAAGVSTARHSAAHSENVSVRGGHGIKFEKSISVDRAPAELYRFWRNLENLPRFMNHLEAVHIVGENRSHWVAKAPAGTTVAWNAEVYNDKPNEMIAWRSLDGSDVDSAGSVHFIPATNGGTVVRVVLKYDPPGGSIGGFVARLFGENPEQQIAEDLKRFKAAMETGEFDIS
jgi:uncharacterized membrane protein